MNEVAKQEWAQAYLNGDFYLVETFSGYRHCARDPKGHQHLLPPNASSEELGAAVLDSIAHSRFLLLDELDDFFDYGKGQQQYEIWTRSLMDRQGYKSKHALFKNMARCGVSVCEGVMKIMPTRHEKLERWGREKDDGIENVVLPADSPPEIIGEALRLAFSRCK